MLYTTRLVAQLIGEEPWLVVGPKAGTFTVKLPTSSPKMAFRQTKFGVFWALHFAIAGLGRVGVKSANIFYPD